MMKIICASILSTVLFGCASPQSVGTSTPTELKQVSLNTFMNNELTVHIPIMLSIPNSYIHADIEAPMTFSYWMPREKIPQAQENQDLPADTGYIYGNISLSVGYDQEKKDFFVDGGYSVDETMTASGFEALEKERITVNNHPVLIMKLREKATGKQFYTIYIGMMIATNNIFIAYLPPEDDPSQEAYVWQQLKKSIKESNNRAIDAHD